MKKNSCIVDKAHMSITEERIIQIHETSVSESEFLSAVDDCQRGARIAANGEKKEEERIPPESGFIYHAIALEFL